MSWFKSVTFNLATLIFLSALPLDFLASIVPGDDDAAKYEIQKPSTCRATLFRSKFSSMFPVFHLA